MSTNKGLTRFFAGFDWMLLAASLFLIGLGLVVIYSVSLDVSGLSRFDKQLIAVGIGILVFMLVSQIDYRRLGSFYWVWYGLSIVLLATVLIIGTNFRGTKGWFTLGPFSLQPVEFVKVASVLILSYFLSRDVRPGISTWISSFLLLLPIQVLLVLQPDFGPMFMIGLVWLLLNALRGLSKRGWLVLIMGTICSLGLLWFAVLTEHQQERVHTFLNPSSDPSGAGFQVNQSIIAVGSGGLLGRGLGQGIQSQLRFLPEAPTDFVFASLLEQLGFVGFLIVFGLWVVVFWRIARLVKRSRDPYTLYVTVGLGLLLFFQTLINIAMNLGLAPIVGLPLPLMSYGGSSLIASFVLLGIFESIAIRQRV